MPAWNPKANDIFLNALEISTPEGRRAFIEQACGSEAELRAQVDSLIAASQKAGSFLESPAPAIDDGVGATINQLPLEKPGTQIGPYKLLQQIGEGGMGVVYMAEQKEPVRRKVALKLIKPGMDTRQVVARFEAERQALAMMNHPNIAKVLDAGTTDGGRPYFVMELVKGAPITNFCDEQKLDTRQRLQLFVTACQAVQHAHQKGLIHRDLKPSNLLVEMHDVTPVPKVIDFGVAKAIGQQLTELTLHTGFTQMVGTPLYMSPEQAGQSSIDVDTRSDIYSLGVLLYELLTGTTPFDKETLTKAGYDEMRRMIREEEPPRPSARVSTLQSHPLSTVSECRRIEPYKLSAQLRGELDWIAMKALDKDRSRRYESASALAADVQRYLNDEPVQACPPSTSYRIAKFSRRNKVWLTAVAMVGFALLLGAGVSIWQAYRAKLAGTQAKANEVRALQGEQKARQLAEMESKQRELTASNLKRTLQALDETYVRLAERLPEKGGLNPDDRKLLEQILKFYEEFARENATDSEMQYERIRVYYQIGDVYSRIGQPSKAAEALRRGISLSQELVAQPQELEADDVANRLILNACRDQLGLLIDGPEAEQLLRETIQDLERLITKKPAFETSLKADLARSLVHLGGLQTDVAQADRSYERAEELLRYLVAKPSVNPDVQTNLGVALYRRATLIMNQQPAEASKYLREATACHTAVIEQFPGRFFDRAKLGYCYHQLGNAQQRLGDSAAAEKTFVLAAISLEAVVAALPGEVEYRINLGEVQSSLGTIRANSGRPEEAEPAFRRAIELQQKLADEFPDRPDALTDLALAHYNLGNVLNAIDRKPEAEGAWLKAVKLSRLSAQKFPNQSSLTLVNSLSNLGTLAKGLGRYKEAKSLYLEAATTGRELVAQFPDVHVYKHFLGVSLQNLATSLYEQGDVAEALRLMDEAISRQEEAQPSLSWFPPCGAALIDHYETLAEWLANTRVVELRNPSRAVELARKAVKLEPESNDPHRVLGVACYRAGDAQSAVAELNRGLQPPADDSTGTVTVWLFLSMAHSQLGNKEQARQWYERATEWITKNQSQQDPLVRWRDEAAELLGINDKSKPKTKPSSAPDAG